MASQPQPSFLLIVQLHHLQAMLQLGAIVNPLTGKTNPPNLDKARHELALLDILKEKTAGNLTDDEEDILTQAISTIHEAIDASVGGENRMRIGVFGGTFDPPHLGHALACLWALETDEVDRIVMIPTANHAFGKKPGADFTHRMEMCRLAVRHLTPYVEVSDIETHREGTSYMVDTLRALHAQHSGDTFRLIIGTDVENELLKWKEPVEVQKLAPLLLLPRNVSGVAWILPSISSTAIRSLLGGSGDPAKAIGKPVLDYISEHSLYKNHKKEKVS